MRRDFFPDIEKLERECTSESHDAGDSKESTLQLDEFLTRYESEDDSSFTGMLVEARRLHQHKHAWLHKQEQQAQLSLEKKLAIEDSSEYNRRAGLDSWTYTAKNSLMYVPDGVGSSAVEAIRGSNENRKIVHSNTRLPEQFVQKTQVSLNLESRKPARDKVGVDGKVVAVDESPKVNGYGFLSTPLIKPGLCLCN